MMRIGWPPCLIAVVAVTGCSCLAGRSIDKEVNSPSGLVDEETRPAVDQTPAQAAKNEAAMTAWAPPFKLQNAPASARLSPPEAEDDTPKKESKDTEDGKQKQKKHSKTLLEWTLGNGKNKGNDEDKERPKDSQQHQDRQYASGKTDDENEKTEENGEDEESKVEKEKPKRIDPDRPHLPEASTTVGLGRVVLEAGYTYNTSGGFFPLQSFPEALLRVGMFADWFEFRVAQNLANETAMDAFGKRSSNTGAEDLQIGMKLALTEQQGCLPESALLVQMTVPTGSNEFTANRVLPGIHFDCTWEIIKDVFSVETVIFADGAVDAHGHTFTQMGDGVTAVCELTRNLEAFGEIDSFYAAGDSAPPQDYLVGGFVYFFTDNFAIDWRAGVGLNAHAEGYLFGSGFAVRY